MSRIAKNPIKISKDVECNYSNGIFSAKGKLGHMEISVNSNYNININTDEINVVPLNENNNDPNWGTTRAIIANIVNGVTNGFSKTLELNGTGYRASVSGSKLKLELGYSHDINFEIPEGIKIEVEKQTILKISGFDKQLVGVVASKIKTLRKIEPYKGKGIREKGQYILKKEGKKK